MRLVWMQLRSYPVVQDGRALVTLNVIRAATDVSCRPSGATHAAPTPWPALPLQQRLTAAYDWIASPGYVLLSVVGCQTELLEERHGVKVNQWLLVATVMMATLMTRFLTSSWTVALIVAAMLFSRGRLLADIGTVSTDAPIMFLVTAWVSCCAHFLRTGAAASLALAVASAAAAALFDRSLLVLSLVMPALLLGGYLYRRRLARPVIRRLRGASRRLRVIYGSGAHTWPVEDSETGLARVSRAMRWLLGMEFPPADPARRWRPSYQRGTLFRTIEVPFLLWAYWRKRWLALSLGWLAAAVATAAALVAVYWALFGPAGAYALSFHAGASAPGGEGFTAAVQSWTAALGERVDLHLAISLIIMAVCAVQSPAAGLSSFLECIWLTLLAAALLLGAAFLADLADLRLVHALAGDGLTDPLLDGLAQRPVLLWLEPVVLSLGVAGLYNLMKVLDTRIAERA